jgi:hypothetical protein
MNRKIWDMDKDLGILRKTRVFPLYQLSTNSSSGDHQGYHQPSCWRNVVLSNQGVDKAILPGWDQF